MIYKSPITNHFLFVYIATLALITLSFGINNFQANKHHRQDDRYSIKDTENDLIAVVDEEDENSIGPDEAEKNKFTWANHHNDHSLYSRRSLMSTDSIKNMDLDDDELETLKKSDFVEKEWQLMFRSWDMKSDSVATSMLVDIARKSNVFEDILERLEPACRRDLNHLRRSFSKHKLWALRMADSNGKIPSGISRGRFSSPGDYEECLSVRVDEDVYVDSPKLVKTSKKYRQQQQLLTNSGNDKLIEHYKFDGKYCLIDFRLPLPEKPKNKILSIFDSVLDLSGTELAKRFPEVLNYSSYASVFYEVGYMHGFCLPSSCDVHDLTKSIGKSLEGLYVIVNNTVDCQLRSDHNGGVPLRFSQIISFTLLSILFINATLATIVHHYEPEQDGGNQVYGRNKVKRLLSGIGVNSRFYSDCFSIQSNFYRLTKPDPKGLTFVHYTRIVAMALTVITHTGALGTLQAITKPADASASEAIFRDLLPQMLANAFTSIQIFFFMAGFMLVVSTYPAIKKDRGQLSFVEYAVKRAIRLMPGLVATIAINFIWPLFIDGPMLTYFDRMIVEPCEKNWYRTLGFVSNFDHVEKMCLRHSYFSASDYQLHVMAFPLLILLYKYPLVSLSIATILVISGFVAQVIMTLTKIVLPFMAIDYLDKDAFFNVIHYIHHPVWNHMSAFFYGFIIGYLVVRRIRINISPSITKLIWWIIGPLGICSLFAPYFWNHYKRPIVRWQMVLYLIFDRFILLTTCAWLSYATLVLANGRPRNNKRKEESAPAPVQHNLPEVVAIDQAKLSVKEHQATGGGGGDLPRQRSSPNLQSLKPDQSVGSATDLGGLKSSLSSANLSSSAEAPGEIQFKTIELKQQPQQQQQAKPANKKPRNVSNVNTLCLVLSRLTFQLYLFNMVVLWVDVNHSKYFWYFSYYFIIVKASAVYICSTIMATIFFVTLESPCLSLYIAWIKSRAMARNEKKKEEAREADRKAARMASDAAASSMPHGGLRLRIRTPDCSMTASNQNIPKFSYIDLSQEGANINQTRM